MLLVTTLTILFAARASAYTAEDPDDASISILVKRLFEKDSNSYRNLLAARAGADFDEDLAVTRHSRLVTPVPEDSNSYRDLLAARAGADFDEDFAMTRHSPLVTPVPAYRTENLDESPKSSLVDTIFKKDSNSYRNLLAARAGADFDEDLAVTRHSRLVTPVPEDSYRDLLAARAGADFDEDLAVTRHS
ncbi:uncharacterized protein LOC132745689, partial [Ruditapes philippinarum]|uniref:uncharacterized protein LOC132745689 n=1 Tax=Ruditapes philippinarum TaxID=129788 RepID=UPI00295C0497